MSDSVTPWTVAHQAPLSVDFPGKDTEVIAISSSGESPQPKDKPVSPSLAGIFFATVKNTREAQETRTPPKE